MKKELDDLLVKKYPKIFRDRYKPMNQTCMCWGFEHGDGWYHILDRLCANIQHHIDWQRKCKANDLKFNRALRRAIEKNDTNGLLHYYKFGQKEATENTHAQVKAILKNPQYREVNEVCRQLIADQVKEKFGTLRFYYHGGDDVIDGMVRMAEAMSAVTCERCGVPSETETHDGWVSTICPKCRRAITKERKEAAKRYAETKDDQV